MYLITKIENKDGQLIVSSRVVAEQLGKEHKNVIRDLENILAEGKLKSEHTIETLIISSTYINEQNKQEYKEYLLTEEGFTLYMFNIQGFLDFKLAYIQEFKRMREALQKTIAPTTLKEALQLALAQQEELERLALVNNQQEQVILEYTPKVEYYDSILSDSKSLLTVNQIAKDYGLTAQKLNKILKEESIQYKQSGVWLLYKEHAQKGLTKSITWNNEGHSGLHTKFTQKGRLLIHELLKKRNIKPFADL